MKRTSIYRRLTGRSRTLLGYSQLWLGPDHILLLKSSHFAEEYRRFALSDIQAIVITGVPDRTMLQVFAAGAALSWILAFLAVTSIFGKVFFTVTGAVALAWVIADIARGPRCRCHLYTAVSRELLTPVSRVRAARAFLGRIRPAIEAVQGKLDTEIFAQPAGPVLLDQPPKVAHAPGYLPEALFALLLVDATMIGANQLFPKFEIGSILPTTFFAEILLVVVALVRRGARDPRRIIYGLMIVVIVCIGWDTVSLAKGLGNYWVLVADAARRNKPAPLLTTLSWASHGAALFAFGWRLAAGAIGLAAAYLERHSGAPE